MFFRKLFTKDFHYYADKGEQYFGEERYVDRDKLALRALTCLRAYKKFNGLYDLSLLVATVDGSDIGAQGRFDVFGVSYENAQRMARHYLDAFGPTATGDSKKTAAMR